MKVVNRTDLMALPANTIYREIDKDNQLGLLIESTGTK